MKILIVNGIRSHGEGNVDILGAELRRRGFEVVDVDQPIRHTWDARSATTVHADAMDIVRLAKDGDKLICHSYGGVKSGEAIWIMHRIGVHFSDAYFYRPAMSREYKFPAGDHTRITCIHSHGDFAVWLGGLLRFNHPFGWAGTRGFLDPRVNNIKVKGRHNSDFKPKAIQHWADHIEADHESTFNLLAGANVGQLHKRNQKSH